MSPAEAAALQPNEVLVARHTFPSMTPRRIAELYTLKSGDVMIRFKMTQQWVRAELYDHPPAGHRWNGSKHQWVPG